VLEALAVEIAHLRAAEQVVSEEGVTMEEERETGVVMKEHPAVRTAARSASIIGRLIDSFGGSPAARIRLGLAAMQATSLADQLEADLAED
jgi:P27 family predicted phage terminase small subunit